MAAVTILSPQVAQFNQRLTTILAEKALIVLNGGTSHLVEVSQTAPTITAGTKPALFLYINHLPPISSARHTALKVGVCVGATFTIGALFVGVYAGAFLVANLFVPALGLGILLTVVVFLASTTACVDIAHKLIDKINLSLQEKRLAQLEDKAASLRAIMGLWINEIAALRYNKAVNCLDGLTAGQDITHAKDELMKQVLLYGEDNRFNKDAFGGTKDLTEALYKPGEAVYQHIDDADLFLIKELYLLKSDQMTSDSTKNRLKQLMDEVCCARVHYHKHRILLSTSHDPALQDFVECKLVLPSALWSNHSASTWALFPPKDEFKNACIRFLGLGTDPAAEGDMAYIKATCTDILNRKEEALTSVDALPMHFWTYFLMAEENKLYPGHMNDVEIPLTQELLDASESFTKRKFCEWMLNKITAYEEKRSRLVSGAQ